MLCQNQVNSIKLKQMTKDEKLNPESQKSHANQRKIL